MKYQFYFRAAMMVVSLAAVLWVRHTLKERGLNNSVATAVGVAPISARVDLCETRVTRLKVESGIELFENGMHWMMRKNGLEKMLDPVSVEKWFGANCSVLADDLRQVASNDRAAAKPLLTFDFIQGGSQALRVTDDGSFIWKQIAFHSQQLKLALADLHDLREAGPNGRPLPQAAKKTHD